MSIDPKKEREIFLIHADDQASEYARRREVERTSSTHATVLFAAESLPCDVSYKWHSYELAQYFRIMVPGVLVSPLFASRIHRQPHLIEIARQEKRPLIVSTTWRMPEGKERLFSLRKLEDAAMPYLMCALGLSETQVEYGTRTRETFWDGPIGWDICIRLFQHDETRTA